MLRFLKPINQKTLIRSYSEIAKFKDPNIFIEKLNNGLTVAIDSRPTYFSGVGVYINAGSRYEGDNNNNNNNNNGNGKNKNKLKLSGISHLTDRLAFKSTQTGITSDEFQNRLQSLGGIVQCSSARETIIYQASVPQGSEDEIMNLLSDTVIRPSLTNDEILEQLQTVSFELEELNDKPDLLLPEYVHMAGFHNNTLGLSLLCPPERLNTITREEVLNYRNLLFRPERTVVAISGLSFNDALNLANKHFGSWSVDSNENTNTLNQVAHYTGGEIIVPSPPYPIPGQAGLPPFYHLHIAFEGLKITDPDMYALAVLQRLLGGGTSFSAGGPGKGMYARLYTHVLNRNGLVESCISFSHSYTDTGLFGIAMSCQDSATPYMAEELARQFSLVMQDVADDKGSGSSSFLGRKSAYSTGGVTPSEVNRAKNQLRSQVLMDLESRAVALEDLGRQVQTHGRYVTKAEMEAKISAVTPKDVQNVAMRILTGNVGNAGNGNGKPTVVIQGDDSQFGDVFNTLARYNLGRSN